MNNKILFIVIFILFSYSTIFANYTATGKVYIFQNQVQKARKQAFENAKKNILTQAIQINFSQNIIDKKWILLQQEVFTQPNKYLKEIKIISEKKKGDFYFFQISAKISIVNIKNYLQKKTNSNNKTKVFLLYFTDKSSYTISDFEVRLFFQNLQQNDLNFILEQDSFTNKIWDAKNQLLRIQKQKNISNITSDKIDKADLFTQLVLADLLQEDYQIAIITRLKTVPDNTKKKFIFQKNAVSLNSRIYDLEAGLIKEKNISLPFFSNSKINTTTYQKQIHNNIISLADLFLLYLEDYFGSYFFTWKNKKYQITFNNFNQIEEEQIKLILKNLVGYKNSISQRNRNSLKFSYYSSLSSERIYQLLRINLEKKNLKTKLQKKNFEELSFFKIPN